MSMTEFLDRYIQGERGSWFFTLELPGGVQISGGSFYMKQHARDNLLSKLVKFLDGEGEETNAQTTS